jgi:hypothetical protein
MPCAGLPGEFGISVSPATFDERACKRPMRRQVRDEQAMELLLRAEREHLRTGKFGRLV